MWNIYFFIFYAIIITRMNKITKYLNQMIIGNAFDNPEVLEAFSTDRSVLKIRPKFVTFPESTEDVKKLLCFFNEMATKNIPISVTVRGSGLGEGGACLSNGVIISMEKLNKLLEIEPRDRLVRVQAGITLKELNTALSVSGLTIPISGHENETIGGLISTYPIDNYASKYGGIYRYVERIEAILPNGECLQTSRLKKYNFAKIAAEKTLEGNIYQKIAKLLKEKDELIRNIDSHVYGSSGYPMITRVAKNETVDLMPLFFGAEGTLGVITEVILKAVPMRKKPMRAVMTAKNIDQMIKSMISIKSLRPKELNLYDLKIVQEARESGKNLDGIIKKLEDGFVAFMSFDEFQNITLKKLEELKASLAPNTKIILEKDKDSININELENSLACYLNHVKNGERTPILTNFYIPSWNLSSFLKDLEILKEKLELDLLLYGSYANSIYSLRPKFNLEEDGINKKIATFLRAGSYIIYRQGGVLDAGESTGRLKATVSNEKLLDSERELYEEIKNMFDRNNILNPGVKLGADSKFSLTHFRSEALPKNIF